MKRFSNKERNQFLEGFQKDDYDLVIIGGGITGVGILLDAQSRGMKTALIEMQDFAAGTSSRSTKLIHGGLRYLKNLEFKLVAEVGRERAIVYDNGPHVTKAEPMLLPIVKNGSLNKFMAGLGVWIYDLLAGVKKHEHRKMLSVAETSKAEPLLREELLKGGVLYYEYRTDDARLTIDVLKKAVELGAVAVNYAKAEAFVYEGEKIVGVKVHDTISGKDYTVHSKAFVNATGPWVDNVMSLDNADKGGKLFITKGVHVVVDKVRLPVQQSAYFDVGDGRMVFVIPREGKTYIGTTDTPYSGDFKNPKIEKEDIEYLIKAVNKIFKNVSLKESDIISGWAGLRPLIRQQGKSASEISRKDEIFVNPSGLISIAGGKLTGYRKMAEKITDLVSKKLKKDYGMSFKPCHTEHLPIAGGEVGGSVKFHEFVSKVTKEGIDAGLSEEDAKYIALHYGTEASALYDIARYGKEEAKELGLPLRIYAQLVYAIDYEMAIAPSDFLVRRSGILYFHPEKIHFKNAIVSLMDVKFKLPEEAKHKFLEDLEEQIRIAIVV